MGKFQDGFTIIKVYCLGALETQTVEIYKVLKGCPLPRRKCSGALIALSKTIHTDVDQETTQVNWGKISALAVKAFNK